jgi:Cupredoxin-like domain
LLGFTAVTRKLWSVSLVLGLLSAACASSAPGARNVPIPQFVPQVVDFLDDSGRSPSIALNQDGDPTLAYLGLPQKLAPGEIAAARPLSLPMIPAVLTASLVNSVWNHGAIVATEDSAKPIPLKTTDEAALAIDPSGTEHAAFTLNGALQYATADAGGEFGEPKRIATGKFTGLSIAADSSGTPWVSYYRGSNVEVATQNGKSWSVQRVGTADLSRDLPERTSIQAGKQGAVVAFTDGHAPVIATQAGGGWATRTLAGTGGFGISLALDGATPHVAYYAETGEVREQVARPHSPSTTVAQVENASANLEAGWSTAIGFDDKGTGYVGWYDAAADETRLAASSGQGFSDVPVDGTEGGQLPVLAVAPDGSQVFVAWYDRINQDLHMGTFYANGAPKGITLAQESSGAPAPTGGPPTPAGGCSPSGIKLTVEAPPGAAGAGFNTDCLAAPAKQAFTVDFDNKDPGVPHNFEIFTDQSATKRLGGASSPADIIVGPDTATYNVDALQPGNYYFQCDVHPTTMTGSFVVK